MEQNGVFALYYKELRCSTTWNKAGTAVEQNAVCVINFIQI
jgi:hypothetical protein